MEDCCGFIKKYMGKQQDDIWKYLEIFGIGWSVKTWGHNLSLWQGFDEEH
jgi:hypothetical protein